MSEYEPELGQALWGPPSGAFGCPDFVDALLENLLWNIEVSYWNVNQKRWDRLSDPGIPGLSYRPHYWGDDESEAALPNFKLASSRQEIRWYKHPGRGMSCSVDMSNDQWVAWYDLALDIIRKFGGRK